jgi:hypothetical protein
MLSTFTFSRSRSPKDSLRKSKFPKFIALGFSVIFFFCLPVVSLAQSESPRFQLSGQTGSARWERTVPLYNLGSPSEQTQLRQPLVVPSVADSQTFPAHTRFSARTPQSGSAPKPIFFEAPIYGSGGNGAAAVAVADVNGDGKLDLLVANLCSQSTCASHGSVGVLFGNGDGTFQPAAAYDSGGYSPSSIAVGDVNGDGKLDIIVANECGATSNCNSGSVGVLLGNGDGTFRPALTFSSGGYESFSLAVSDVNSDGKLDVLVTNYCVTSSCTDDGTVGVLLGKGNGTFQPVVTYDAGNNATVAIAVGDVNRDGHPDVMLASLCLGGPCEIGGYGNEGSASVLLGNGDGTFKSPVSYRSNGIDANAVAVADVNGDGILDLLVTSVADIGTIKGYGQVEILLGRGDGTFGSGSVGVSTGGYDATSLVVADVNGDGKPDLLIANQCSEIICYDDVATLGVMLGNGDGTFQNPLTFDLGDGLGRAIAVADVNGDSKADVLVPAQGFSSGVVDVLLGIGKGAFHAATTYYPGENSWGVVFVAAGDLNGDGYPDLAVQNHCQLADVCPSFDAGSPVGVMLGNGDGTFGSAIAYFPEGFVSPALAIADVNRDGKPDLLIVSNFGSSSGGPVLGVGLGNGDGTFQPSLNYSLNYTPSDIAAGDFNHDGKVDVVVSDTEGVEVLLGNGDGTFNSPTEYTTGSTGEGVAVGDVNGDGVLDLVVANLGNGTASSGSVSVLLGNGDGTFQPAVGYNSGAVYTTAVALADMNKDGKLDIVLTSADSNSNPNGVVGILLGNGDGTFQSTINTATPALGDISLAVADFNGDGKLDVAIGYGDVLLLGNGNGTFQTPIILGASGLGIAAADFNGDGRPDLAVGALTILLNVSLFSTTTTLTSSPNPSNFGQKVTFKATVTHKGSGALSGTVTFFDGTEKLGTKSVDSIGEAVLVTSTLRVGTHKITAVYNGNAAFASSKSPELNQVVK